MADIVPDPFAAALFLVFTMSTAGVAQVLWLRSGLSKRLLQPLDLGLTVRGRRLFGENKTVRGFVVMVPATALSFVAWSALWPGLWPLAPVTFAALGAMAGLGFMLGELPNSALKRQLDVPPGEAPTQPGWRWLSLALDRTDSLLGALLAVHLLVGLPWLSWLLCLVLGPGIHAVFSFALHKAGVKRRAA